MTRRSLADGIRFLAGHPVLRPLWALNVVLAVFNALAQAVFVLYVLDLLGLPAAVYGLFAMAAGAGLVLVGASVAAWNIVSITVRQELVPGRLLGRVHGAWRTLGWGLMPVGTFAGGLLGSIDLRLPFIVGGIGIAAAGLVVRRTLLVLSDSD